MSSLSFYLPHTTFLLCLFFDPEDGGDTHHQNVSGLQGAAFQEMELLITAGVRTSKPYIWYGSLDIYSHPRGIRTHEPSAVRRNVMHAFGHATFLIGIWRTVKVKVMLSLCLIKKHYAMKTYLEMDVYIHVFLTSVLVGVQWSALPPGKEPPVPIG
jgi:hypothetical protein